MMQDQTTATLATIFSDVLQDLAFMFSDEDDGISTPGNEWVETRISYAGPHSATIRLRCPRDFTVRLAGNLLNVDPTSEEAAVQAYDAVKEFMNILCGQLITTLHGPDDVFDLTIPVIHELEETPDFADVDGGQTASYTVQGNRVQVLYHPED